MVIISSFLTKFISLSYLIFDNLTLIIVIIL